jgi:hypothetical protein
MKKIYIIFVLLFITTTSLISQSFPGGFKLGVVGSQVSGDRLSGFDKMGIYGGLFAGVNLNDEMRIMAELSFVQKGSRQNAKPQRGLYSSYLMRLNYIEIPIMLVWQGNDYFEIEGGLSWGLLIKNSEVEFDENGVLPGMQKFNKNEYSIHIGFHYLLNENIRASFRLNNSILPIREHSGGATYLLNRGQYNTALMLGLTFLY